MAFLRAAIVASQNQLMFNIPMPAKKKTTKKKPAARPKVAAKKAARRTAPKAAQGHAPRRQPESLRLRAAAPSLTVNDVHKSLAWYCDVLGFTAGERWEQDGKLAGVELVAGSVTFYIAQDDWKKG